MSRPRLRPERGYTLCARLRDRNACPHVTRVIRRATLYRKVQKNATPQNVDEHFVRACAVEMHVHMSQETSEEALDTGIYRKNAADQSEHPDQAPASTLTVRTPQCGHTALEEKKKTSRTCSLLSTPGACMASFLMESPCKFHGELM